MVEEKLGFDTYQNRNWVVRLGLKIHSNSQGKLGFDTLSKSQLGSQTRFENSFKRVEKNYDFTLCQITIG